MRVRMATILPASCRNKCSTRTDTSPGGGAASAVGLAFTPKSGFYRRARDCVQLHQPLLELLADHVITVDEQPNGFGNEAIPSGHGPSDTGLAIFRFERELGNVRAFKWPHKIQPKPDQFIELALGDSHAAFTDVLIAGPAKNG